ARRQGLLDPVGERLQLRDLERPRVGALHRHEQEEAVAVALVPRQQLAVLEALGQLLDQRVDLRAQRLVGAAAEVALDARERREVDQDHAQPALFPERAAHAVLDLAERRDHAAAILRPGLAAYSNAPNPIKAGRIHTWAKLRVSSSHSAKPTPPRTATAATGSGSRKPASGASGRRRNTTSATQVRP